MTGTRLVPVEPSMHAELYRWRSDPFAQEHNPLDDVSFAVFSERMRETVADPALLYSGPPLRRVLLRDGVLLASIGLSSINARMKTAQIGYQVSPEHRRQGVGTQVVRDFVHLIFSQTDLRKISALIADQNVPSCRLVERVGFQQEGLLREHFLINGVPTDERLYSLLRSDWGG